MKNTPHTIAPALATAGAVAAGVAAFAFVDYPLFARWGATREEAERPLPGDELVPDGLQSTRGITVHGTPEAVWPWLIQTGQDRGGFYSYDWLERMFGAEIHNAEQIQPEWQHLTVGDTIWPYPERKLRAMAKRSSDVGGWKVVVLEPVRALVVQSHAGRWTWALVLEPLAQGRTRLLARTRFAKPANGLSRFLDSAIGQPAHLVMEMGVLGGVKDRVERAGPGRHGRGAG
jgi:hypothetical protein